MLAHKLDSNMGCFESALPVQQFPDGLVALWKMSELSAADRKTAEQAMAEMPQLEIPTDHKFSVGVYARTVYMPSGAFVIGKLHATEHLNIISAGRCTVWTEQSGFADYEGPVTFNSVAGTKKYLFVHENTAWTTIHVTETRDIDELEKEIINGESVVLGVGL